MRSSGQQGRLLLQSLQVGCEARRPSVVAHKRERCDLVHLELVTHHNGELVLLPCVSAFSTAHAHSNIKAAIAAHLQL